MAHVVAVSAPRSGHHILEYMLRAVLGNRFGYCEFYTTPDCCGSIPCTKASNLEIGKTGLFMQKSHDFQLNDPADVKDAKRLIQYRSPVMRTLSNYELFLKHKQIPRDRYSLLMCLCQDGAYFRAFYRKWLNKPASDTLHIMQYEDILADPYTSVEKFLDFCQVEFDRGSFRNKIEKVLQTRATTRDKFVERKIDEEFRDLLADYEDFTFKACSGLKAARHFEERPAAGKSPFEALLTAVEGLKGHVDLKTSIDNAKIAKERYQGEKYVEEIYNQLQDKLNAS
jgi:hypothetical protein